MSRDYDDWKLDTPDNHEKIFCNCDQCGEPIYIGEDYIEISTVDENVHSEGDCFEEYVNSYFRPKHKEAK
jgi:hypothetical protein